MLLTAVLTLLIAPLACSGGPAEAPPKRAPPPPSGPNLILITLDTTRADALGVYGAPGGVSPALDALAAQGARFDWAFSHAPATLSAHVSLLSGLDPHGHQVPRNGHPVPAELGTLAKRLDAAGYSTLAVLGASVLDGRYGLSRGFDTYDDDQSVEKGPRYESLAEAVTARSLAAVDAREDPGPVFLWAHYFDAHAPYQAPEPCASRFIPTDYTPSAVVDGDPNLVERFREGRAAPEDLAYHRAQYQAEVCYIDAQVSALLAGLEARGLLKDALVVVAGDHGEGFFEDTIFPVGHGGEIDLFATRVPLLMRGTGSVSVPPVVIETPVALSDVAPTVLGLLGQPAEMGEGRDLRPLLMGESVEDRPIFLEATKPRLPSGHKRWNNIRLERGVIYGGQLLIAAPFRGPGWSLYQVAEGQPMLGAGGVEGEGAEAGAEDLRRLLNEWDAAAPGWQADMEEVEVREELKELGYLE